MKELNDSYHGLISRFGKKRLLRRANKLTNGTMPINDVHWTYLEFIKDKVMSMEKFRFVEYEELINQNIKPFKK